MRGDFRMSKNPEAQICLLALLATAQQVAEGILHLHKADILHCDLSGGQTLLPASACKETLEVNDQSSKAQSPFARMQNSCT